jgi:MFS family permease
MGIQQSAEMLQPVGRQSTPRMRWRLALPPIGIIWVLGMIDKSGAGVIATDDGFLNALHLHGKDGLIGFISTITLIFYGASMPIWGALIDKFGPKRCAATGLVFWAISTAICGLAPNYGILLFGRALLGVAEGFLWPLSNAVTARWFPRSERSRAKSVWIGAINLGFAVAAYLINAAIGVTNWRGAFFLLTILALVVALPAALFWLKDDPSKVSRVSAAELELITKDSVQAQIPEAERRNLMLSVPFLMVLILAIANNASVWGIASWFPSYLKEEQHINKTLASGFVAISFILCIIVTPFIGAAMDKIGRKAIFGVGGFGIAAVFLLLSRAFDSTSFELVSVIIAIVGIEGVTTIAQYSVLHMMAPERRMGRAAGIMSGGANFIGAWGATVIGALIDAGGYSLAFGFLTVIFVVGAAASVVLHRMRY